MDTINPNTSFLMKLADFYSTLNSKDIPEEVMNRARRSLVDFFAVLISGFHKGELSPIMNHYLLSIGGKPESTVLPTANKAPAIHAALAMGVMAHSVELDDGHRFGTCHPSVAIIPSVLAVAERNNNTLEEILKAIVVGYDVMLRLSTSINPSHLKRGFHSTGTCGSIGSAAAAAALLQFASLQMAYAMSIGGLQSAGIQEMLHDHPSIKPLQAGKAAYHGIFSCDLVLSGAEGPRTLFEGPHGWLKAMSDNFSSMALLGDLGKRWEILRTYIKLYPTCRHCHPAIDLSLELRKSYNFSIDDINNIIIETYDVAISEVGLIEYPKNFDDAMFSLPFSVALALRDGKVVLNSYCDSNFNDERLMNCIKKIKILENEGMARRYPIERGSIITIKLNDGNTISKSTSLPKGEPETQVNDTELFEKIQNTIIPYYDQGKIKKIWDICINSNMQDITYSDILSVFSGD